MCAGSTVGMTGAGRAEEAGNLAEGSERRVYTDPVTGRAIWQLTNSNLESKHSYYDACPWNYDGSLIVVNSIDPAHLSVGPKGAYGSSLVGKDAMVRVISTKDWTIRTIAKEASYNSHTGSFALWHPKKNRVFFHRADGEVGVVDVDSGEEAIFPGGLRQLAPDGSMMVYFANSEKASSEQYDSRQLPITGVYVASTDGSESHEVVSEEELYNLAPNRDEFTLDDMTIGNSKWHPSSEYILVANFIHPVPSAKRSLFVVKKDGSEARWLCHFVHHHSWTPNGESVLFNGQTSEGKIRMFMVDFDGSNLRLVIDEPIGSHPVMSVDGNTIADFDWKGIYITRVREQKVERLAEFKETFPMDVSGTHPHPVWSRDGKQLLYNSAETGHSEVYIIPDLA